MKSPAVRFYAADFLTGTDHMSCEEVGFYIRLICYSWLNGGLRDEPKVLGRLGRWDGAGEVPEVVIRKFVKCPDGLLRNPRLEEERGKQEAYSAKQQKKAIARWGERPAAAPQRVEAVEKVKTNGHLDACEAIYALYPRKVGKPAALKSIARALQKTSSEALCAKTRAFCEKWHGKTDLSFCPNPATWFNQERYNDDPATWGPRTDSGLRTLDSGRQKEDPNWKKPLPI